MQPASEEVIRTEGLTKAYPPSGGKDGEALTAVDQLDLAVHKGEIFGLLGPNGAGKTTTVGMLTTRVLPSAGRASVSGIDVVTDPAKVKRSIGVVPQLNTLDRSLTVWENLYFHGRYFGMSAKAARARSDELLHDFRLENRARSDVRTLSGGMAQRLMLARAIAHHPAVLFLDEPTAGLDPQSRLALWEVVGELHSEGQTVLLTTHYIEEADRFCDRVAIMDHGRILALDTPAQLKLSAAEGRGARGQARVRLARRIRELAAARSSSGEDGGDATAAHSAVASILDTAGRLGLGGNDLLADDVTLETVFMNLTGRDIRE